VANSDELSRGRETRMAHTVSEVVKEGRVGEADVIVEELARAGVRVQPVHRHVLAVRARRRWLGVDLRDARRLPLLELRERGCVDHPRGVRDRAHRRVLLLHVVHAVADYHTLQRDLARVHCHLPRNVGHVVARVTLASHPERAARVLRMAGEEDAERLDGLRAHHRFGGHVPPARRLRVA